MTDHANNSIQHIALIPDGNRRWARERKLKPWLGHDAGFKRGEEVIRACYNYGIPYVTIWIASENNVLKRSKIEVNFLFKVFIKLFNDLLKSPEVKKGEARVRVIGRYKELVPNKKLVAMAEKLNEMTKTAKKYNLTILFCYDGQCEMQEAIKKLSGNKKADYKDIHRALWTGELPPVDLVVRTGGEPHWSAGFMMWLTANSQFYFTENFWPEFGAVELKKAITEYDRRARRNGS